jgi:hypothetical protein
MSKKSHPGDGTKGHGEKGGDITNVSHSSQGLWKSIIYALRNLRRGGI